MSYAAGTETARRPRVDEAQSPVPAVAVARADRGLIRDDAPKRARAGHDPATGAIAVFAGLATGVDLLVSAGAARIVAGGDGDRALTAFLVMFVLGAAAAIYFGERLIKRSFPEG
jgi:hypothetical protein